MAKSKSTKTSEAVQHWLNEISASRKREKEFRKDGVKIRETYAGEKKETTPYNVLFSNTETMMPALYSAIPRPIVQRRYKDDDALGKAAAQAGQRALEFLLDTNLDGYETFDEAMRAATLDALLPGRGTTTIKYDAEMRKSGEGDQAMDVKASELVCPEIRSWNRVYYGYAKKWSKMPWIAYEEHIDKEEAKRLFGDDIAAKIEFTTGEEDQDEAKGEEDERNIGDRKTALIYQIWDKNGGNKIRYVSPHYKDDYLKVEDDTLGMSGFYNCPKPLMFVEKTDDLTPTSLYSLYENQAIELNSLTSRINRIISAIKARGLYDGELGDDVARLMEADDNELLPAEKGASLAAEKGLDNAIWFMPLDMLVATLKELYVAREQCKQVIYEILGIADILRGSSNPNETLGAQQIKTQWGSLRLKPKQAEVQRYARDILRMMLEIAATKFSEETWARMTGLPYLTQMQVQQATQVAQAAAQQGNMGPAQQLQQQVTWKQILETLRDDMQRAYKVDIETNSTIQPEAAEDQKNISDLMTAIGQFLNGVGPLILQGAMPFETAQTMLLAIVRRFRFGTEIEDQIRQMQPPKPPDDGKGDEAAQKEAAATQKDMQSQAKISQLETQLKGAQSENQLIARKSELDIWELKLNTQEQHFQLEQKVAQDSLNSKAQGEHQKIDHKKQLVGLEAKNAKTEQTLVKQTDAKLSQSVGQMAQLIQELTQVSTQVLQAVTAQSEQNQELLAAVKAPRRKKAIRDKDGRITESIEEVVQ